MMVCAVLSDWSCSKNAWEMGSGASNAENRLRFSISSVVYLQKLKALIELVSFFVARISGVELYLGVSMLL